VFALALLQFAVLAARYVPDKRAARLRAYRKVLVALCALLGGALISLRVTIAAMRDQTLR
jgi:hypothetical protein